MQLDSMREQQLNQIDHFTQFAWLESLCIERLEDKAIGISQTIRINSTGFHGNLLQATLP